MGTFLLGLVAGFLYFSFYPMALININFTRPASNEALASRNRHMLVMLGALVAAVIVQFLFASEVRSPEKLGEYLFFFILFGRYTAMLFALCLLVQNGTFIHSRSWGLTAGLLIGSIFLLLWVPYWPARVLCHVMLHFAASIYYRSYYRKPEKKMADHLKVMWFISLHLLLAYCYSVKEGNTEVTLGLYYAQMFLLSAATVAFLFNSVREKTLFAPRSVPLR